MLSMMTLMEKVDKLLAKKGAKRADLARALNVDPPRVTKWFQGTGVPDAYQTFEIARYLNVTMEYLSDRTQEGDPPDASWLRDVERFIERVGVDELYMRLYGMRDINAMPKVVAGEKAEVNVTRKPGQSPDNPRRSGSA